MINKIIKILFFIGVSHLMIYAEEIKLSNNNGTYNIPVIINDVIKLNFVIDTGASHVTIPSDVLKTLMRTDTIKQSDILGVSNYKFANGKVEENTVFNIRKMKIGNNYIYNVKASAAKHENAPLLLGQSALKQLEPWYLDSVKGLMHIGNNIKQVSNVKKVNGNNQTEQNTHTTNSKLEIYKKKCLKPSIITNSNYTYKNGKLIRTDSTTKDWTACAKLGGIYIDGKDIEVDNRKAEYFYKKACEYGDGESCGILAVSYLDGSFGEDSKLTIEYWEKACELDKQTCIGLASHYKYYVYPRPDYPNVLKCYKKACDGKIGKGCNYLASMYEKGEGVDRNVSMALELFDKACKMKDLDGCIEYERLKAEKLVKLGGS